ncbi:MAG: FtsX-like permease family protein, partial [Gemmatimonadales bacterium]|nr:FtsX-like permease family protein [Gemmatimonadales bacterium]
GEEEATAQAMLRVLRESGTDLIPAQVRTMTRHLDVMTLPIRLGVVAVASLAILALVLAVIGLYGAVSYAVARRTREVGIRLALGAEGGAVVRILMGTGVRVVLAGVVVGLVLAALVARLMSGLLFGVRAVDPVTFLLVPLLLVGVATLAAWLPARRAMRI